MNNCVGQGYDGASVVGGRLNGVQKKLREKTGSEMASTCIATVTD